MIDSSDNFWIMFDLTSGRIITHTQEPEIARRLAQWYPLQVKGYRIT